MNYEALRLELVEAWFHLGMAEAELEAVKGRHPLWRDQDNTLALRARKEAYKAVREALDRYQEASDRLAQLRVSMGIKGVEL